MSVPPQHEMDVKVCLEGEYQPKTPVLLESDPQLQTVGLQLGDSYVCPNGDCVAVLRLTNPSGFTCRLELRSTVQSAEQATLISENDLDDESIEPEPPPSSTRPEAKPSNSIIEASADEEEEAADVSESVPTPTAFTRHRTRTIVPPNRFM